VARRSNDVEFRSDLGRAARVHDDDPVAISAITPMSCVMITIEDPWIACNRPIKSRIWAWVVTSSAVVGSSAISSFGLHERPWR